MAGIVQDLDDARARAAHAETLVAKDAARLRDPNVIALIRLPISVETFVGLTRHLDRDHPGATCSSDGEWAVIRKAGA